MRDKSRMRRNFCLTILTILTCLIFPQTRVFAQAATAEDLPKGASVVEDPELMASVFERFGGKAPEAPHPNPLPKGEGTETAEEAAEAAAKTETPEQKAEREAAEAAAAEALANETEEEKAARIAREELLAKETPEEKTAREAKEAEDLAKAGTIEFSEEQIAYLEEQVAEKTKEFNDKLTAVETKLAEAEAKLTAAGKSAAPIPATIHPLFLVDDLAKVQERASQLQTFKEWAMANFDGYEATKEGEASYTKEQVRATLAQVEKELATVIPAAVRNLQTRAQYEPVLKAAYPALTDPKSPDYAVMQGFINNNPGIKLFPDYKILVGDALAGEKARLAKNKTKAAATSPGKRTITVVKKLAPKLPIGARSGPQSEALARQRAISASKGGKGVADVAGFVKKGASHDALIETVAGML